MTTKGGNKGRKQKNVNKIKRGDIAVAIGFLASCCFRSILRTPLLGVSIMIVPSLNLRSIDVDFGLARTCLGGVEGSRVSLITFCFLLGTFPSLVEMRPLFPPSDSCSFFVQALAGLLSEFLCSKCSVTILLL